MANVKVILLGEIRRNMVNWTCRPVAGSHEVGEVAELRQPWGSPLAAAGSRWRSSSGGVAKQLWGAYHTYMYHCKQATNSYNLLQLILFAVTYCSLCCFWYLHVTENALTCCLQCSWLLAKTESCKIWYNWITRNKTTQRIGWSRL